VHDVLRIQLSLLRSASGNAVQEGDDDESDDGEGGGGDHGGLLSPDLFRNTRANPDPPDPHPETSHLARTCLAHLPRPSLL
jgi:hypothetical protein